MSSLRSLPIKLPASKTPKDWQHGALSKVLAFLAVIAALVILIDTLVVLYVCYTPTPWDDMWDFWRWSFRYNGNAIWHLAAQHNEHRIALGRIFFLIDEFWFSGTAKFLAVCIPAMQLAHAVLLWILNRKESSFSKPTLWFLGACALGAMFSLQQFANFTWYFQLTFIAVYFCASASFIALLKCGHGSRGSTAPLTRRGRWWLAAAVVFAVCSTYSVANGLLIWPLLLSLAFSLSLTWGARLIILLFGILSWVAYFVGYVLPPGAPSPLQALLHLDQFARFFVCILGSPFAPLAVKLGKLAQPDQITNLAAASGGLGLLGVLAYLILLWRHRRSGNVTRVERVYIHLLLFVLASIGLIASGRYYFPIEGALNSRYTTPALLFWLFLTSLLLIRTSQLALRWAAPASLFYEAAAVTALALFYFCLPPATIAYARGYQLYLDEPEAALANLVFDAPRYAHLNYWQIPAVVSMAKIMNTRDLSVFHERWHPWLGDKIGRHYTLLPKDKCSGFVDSIAAVQGGDLSGYRLTGWAWDNQNSLGRRFMLLTDAEDRLVGSGFLGVLRPDVASNLKKPQAVNSGWVGYVSGLDHRRIDAYILSSDDENKVCLVGSHAVTPSGR